MATRTTDARRRASPGESTRRAVFLDRDGTLIRDGHYAFDPDQIQVLDGAVAGLRILQAAGYRLVVVTNQSGVARGYFAEADVRAMHDRLDALLRAQGVGIAAYYYCPHHPAGVVPDYAVACLCRKPKPGLIHRASADLGLDLRRSWLVGDALTDVLAGRAAGCRTVLLAPDGWPSPEVPATHTARSLREAAESIIAASRPLALRSA